MRENLTCDIWIKNTSYLDETYRVRENVSIAVKDGKILKIYEKSQNAIADDWGNVAFTEVIDGKNLLWMPGLVDGHMHTGQQLLKGAVLDELPMIWTRIMLPFESTLTPEKMAPFRRSGSVGNDQKRNHRICGCRKLLYGRGGKSLCWLWPSRSSFPFFYGSGEFPGFHPSEYRGSAGNRGSAF